MRLTTPLKKNKIMNKFYVQETIGGWRQTPVFEGTYNECVKYLNERNDSRSAFAIVREEELEIDYL